MSNKKDQIVKDEAAVEKVEQAPSAERDPERSGEHDERGEVEDFGEQPVAPTEKYFFPDIERTIEAGSRQEAEAIHDEIVANSTL